MLYDRPIRRRPLSLAMAHALAAADAATAVLVRQLHCRPRHERRLSADRAVLLALGCGAPDPAAVRGAPAVDRPANHTCPVAARSEERRVGKVCVSRVRSGGSPY